MRCPKCGEDNMIIVIERYKPTGEMQCACGLNITVTDYMCRQQAEIERLKASWDAETEHLHEQMKLNIDEYDKVRKELTTLRDRLKAANSCLLSGPGRGDCEHFVGLPDVFDESTTDVYGRPNGWCEICWSHYQIEQLRDRLRRIEELTDLNRVWQGAMNQLEKIAKIARGEE